MGFKSKLQEALRTELSARELELLPGGFQTVGKLIIIKLKPDLLDKKELIGNTFLQLLPYIRSVYINLGGIEGQYRTPEQIEFLAGEKKPLVIHKEHGVKYQFDITKIMFSQGNLRERRHLAGLVNDDEMIVDMFAGIGYFSLPIAVLSNPDKVYSIELNPIAYSFLVKNIELNKVGNKIIPIQGDCKEEVIKLSSQEIKADRIVMGVFPAPLEYIGESLKVAKNSGTIIHFEGVVDGDDNLELYKEFSAIANKDGFNCELSDKRFIKSYGPNLYHVVYDIQVSRSE
ncbi:MAG: class I SAM-dependent methyltransferase family protein [Promethearchaeota archaeon]|nr:MAG: class I SAM-dependent methyltransferase family protein [Candidatus Lokiarchaeota archaeon]